MTTDVPRISPLESAARSGIPTRLGIALFALAFALGPLYTVPGYSSVSNLISELGAQDTRGSAFMVAGFLALGAGIVVDGLRAFRAPVVPFLAFAAFMALAGLFGHRPIEPGVAFDAGAHQVHGALGTLAGFSITVAFAWLAVCETSGRRLLLAAVLAVLCLALPLAMLALPAVDGAIQRGMYAVVLLWLWLGYPRGVRG